MDISLYLQKQRTDLKDKKRPSEAGDAQTAYDKEDKVLKLEENLLYDLLNYLQVIGYVQTVSSAAATTTTTTDDK